jgi:hypothetical protein
MSGETEAGGNRRRHPVRAYAVAVAAVVAAAGAGAGVQLARGGTPAAGPAIAVGQGDIVKVAGAPIGCVVRRQDAEPALDCRRVGPLRGTYGTILTPHRVLVVRFLSQSTARIVFTGRHGTPRSTTCR